MAEKIKLIDDYTHYAYDEEADLEKVPYWIFSAGHTAPGHPRTPMFEWMFLSTANWGFNYAVDKLSIPTHNGIDFRSYHGYELITTTLPKSEEEIKRRTENFREAIRPLIENSEQLWDIVIPYKYQQVISNVKRPQKDTHNIIFIHKLYFSILIQG